MKKPYENSEFKISAPTWNQKFELPDGSYSASDIQHNFKYLHKKYETITDNFQMTIFVNQIENRITCRINTGYYLKLLTLETMKH